MHFLRIIFACAVCAVVSLAHAQSMLTLGGAGGNSTAVAFSLSFTGNKADSGGGTTVTYNSGGDPSIGAADPNRIVAIAISVRSIASVSSATIGGVSATRVIGSNVANGTSSAVEIWYAAVPTGTTATVSVTYNTASTLSSIGVYRIVTSTPTPSAGANNTNASCSIASGVAQSVTVPSGGGMVGGWAYFPVGGADAVTWSGGTVTKDYETDIGSGRFVSSAHDNGSSGTISYSAKPSLGSVTTCLLSLAAWGP